MTNQDHSQMNYELSRENQSLMMSLQDQNQKIVDLKLEVKMLEDGHIELTVKLENANKEIERLTIKLEDADNEIARLGMVLRHQIQNLESVKRNR